MYVGFKSVSDGIQRGLGSLGSSMFGDKKPSNPAYLPYFEEDRNRLGGMLDGRNPYASQDWNTLVGQLQMQASGKGPSLAEQSYRAAAMDNQSALGSMARGSASPQAAREAMLQQGRVGQGMAAGVAQARTQEQLGAQSALASALGQRDTLNQNAYLDILAKQLGLSRDQMQAMIANQNAAVTMAGQPTGFQKFAGSVAQIGGGLSGL